MIESEWVERWFKRVHLHVLIHSNRRPRRLERQRKFLRAWARMGIRWQWVRLTSDFYAIREMSAQRSPIQNFRLWDTYNSSNSQRYRFWVYISETLRWLADKTLTRMNRILDQDHFFRCQWNENCLPEFMMSIPTQIYSICTARTQICQLRSMAENVRRTSMSNVNTASSNDEGWDG